MHIDGISAAVLLKTPKQFDFDIDILQRVGSLSPHKLKQLRILHILSGKDKREIAKEYIWRPMKRPIAGLSERATVFQTSRVLSGKFHCQVCEIGCT